MRLGLAVGKTAAPTAVARNYFKRQIRETARPFRNQFAGFDVLAKLLVAYPKKEAGEARSELIAHFRALQRCRSSSSDR